MSGVALVELTNSMPENSTASLAARAIFKLSSF
jgi:hypothetical protein